MLQKDDAILQVLRNYIIDSKNIRFEGNNYSQEWIKEAKKRGLSNISDIPEALKAFISEKSIKLFSCNNILSERELYARYDIRLEIFAKKIQIEATVLGDLAVNHIIPTAINYQNTLIDNVKGIKEIISDNETDKLTQYQIQTIKEISEHISFIKSNSEKMVSARKNANKIENIREKAIEYSLHVKPYLDIIRSHIDKLELIVDDEIWALPKYRELLFTR